MTEQRRTRGRALALCLVVSAAAHIAALPIGRPHGFDIEDTEGAAAIPVDLLAPEAPPPPPPEPQAVRPAPPKADDEGETKHPVPPVRAPRVDAGAPRDAGADGDARAPTLRDGGLVAVDGPDASVAALAMTDAGLGDAQVAVADAGGAPRDPEAIVGAAGAIQADVILVMLVVNAEVIRQNPVGAQMGYLLRGIPQWNEFMSGTDIDPVRDADWVIVSGPSLINTAKDVVLIHYSTSDAVVDRAVAVVSRKYDRGGPIDAGVPGVKASLAHADRAERVLLRPQPHVLAVVPPSVASQVARQLVSARTPAHVRPGEALYLRLVNPHHPIPEIPELISELHLRVVPRKDFGADVFIDGDTHDAAAASEAAAGLRAMVRRHNDTLTSLLTHGLLNEVEVSSEGPKVLFHLVASRDQIETVASLVGGFLGVEPPPPPAPAGSALPSRPADPAAPRH